jgi:hypothetical protein
MPTRARSHAPLPSGVAPHLVVQSLRCDVGYWAGTEEEADISSGIFFVARPVDAQGSLGARKRRVTRRSPKDKVGRVNHGLRHRKPVLRRMHAAGMRRSTMPQPRGRIQRHNSADRPDGDRAFGFSSTEPFAGIFGGSQLIPKATGTIPSTLQRHQADHDGSSSTRCQVKGRAAACTPV